MLYRHLLSMALMPQRLVPCCSIVYIILYIISYIYMISQTHVIYNISRIYIYKVGIYNLSLSLSLYIYIVQYRLDVTRHISHHTLWYILYMMCYTLYIACNIVIYYISLQYRSAWYFVVIHFYIIQYMIVSSK